jgi:hypothetical protein
MAASSTGRSAENQARAAMVGDVLGDDAGLRRGGREHVRHRVDQLRDGVRGVQVMIEEPVQRGVARPVSLVAARQLRGVGAEQVVERVPAGSVLGDQVRPGELAQQDPCLLSRDAGQAGRGARGDIGARMQSEQPEHPGGTGAQRAV